MNNERKQQMIVGSILFCIIGAIFCLVLYARPDPPPTASSGYYSGPMVSKSNPTIMVDDQGNITRILPSSNTAPKNSNTQVDKEMGKPGNDKTNVTRP